ncbi:MAG: ribosome biosis GTPase / thiamine phosphate phosphatase [Frankiaceae bacterium]|jgi:ribosome biogenesis GTPase|nr:ribosome biosis GTPase / thiamine phosphate phosphatase [Frankiaceae bacterium]
MSSFSDQHLLDLGFTAALAAALPPDCIPARVSRVDRGGCDLLTEAGPLRATLGSALLGSDPMGAACTGDWVAVRRWPDGPVTVEAVLPRRSALVRSSPVRAARPQLLAANADFVLVCHGLSQAPRLNRIERFIALAWESGAQPVVVLTKADLATDAEQLREETERNVPGVPVHAVSATTGHGVEELREYVAPGLTAALIGPSGAGKSTLANALLGAEVLATGEIRDDGKGRHTTVTRELALVPGGGVLLDTPGLRGVGLWLVDEGLEKTFADVEELAAQCRFHDCGHDTEPGCEVQQALADGVLPWRRFESWRKLQREARWVAVRHDARLRAEARKDLVRFSKAVRSQRNRP